MAITLTTIRAQVETQLMDVANLTWSDDTINEAIRQTLADLSRIYGELQTLDLLDGATETTFDDLDQQPLVLGAVAHALTFRVIGRFEEATPEPKLAAQLADFSQLLMEEFHAHLTQTQLRKFQESTSSPYPSSGWFWEEGKGF